MRIALFADKRLGLEILEFIIDQFKTDLIFLYTISKNDIYQLGVTNGIKTLIYNSESESAQMLERAKIEVGFLVWWPNLINKSLIGSVSKYFINTHPSLLPHNRGKHYNFWAIVEESPFGVSLHKVEEGIDNGDIVAQKEITYGWEETGEDLYDMAQKEMVTLFKSNYPLIRSEEFVSKKQDLSKGSIHYGKELELASQINLDETYKARDLLNLLRARTFDGHPACSFLDADETFEVRINIKRI